MTDTAIISEDVEGFGKLVFYMALLIFLKPLVSVHSLPGFTGMTVFKMPHQLELNISIVDVSFMLEIEVSALYR